MTMLLYYNNLVEIAVQSSLWVARIFCLFCLLPQIVSNYKQKCGKGISFLLLVGYLNAFLFLMFFVFIIDLPLAYKFILPLETLAVMVLIFQRLYYDNSQDNKKYWLGLSLNLLAYVLLIPWALSYPIIAISCGWINFVLSIFYQLPQIIKIQKEKSVEGFNFLFVTFGSFAAAIEITTWYLGFLPAQTGFSAIRALVVCLILCVQFYFFRNKHRIKKLPKHSPLIEDSKLFQN